MSPSRLLAAVAVSLALAAPLAPLHAAAPAAPSGVAWLEVADDAGVDAAFAKAREARMPLLLYWGASWCPPCNQLQATLFNRRDFIERSRAFVAVHVDGDRPGAQKLGKRFRVSGYPTLVLLRPDGTEVTRLPGEADPPQVLGVLDLGLSGGRPVAAVLADARAGKPLAANDWRMLAFYSWDTDDQQLASAADRPGLLATLAASCPAALGATRTRLWLKALAASDDGHGVKGDAALRRLVLGVLRDPAGARAQMDVLAYGAKPIVRAVSGAAAGGQADEVVAAYDTALRRLGRDDTLSRADRLAALDARLDLTQLDRLDGEPLEPVPAPLLDDIRAQVARDDREIRDGYERQAVITEAAALLAQAGLMAESDRLLEANLAKSHSPYYLMSQLAGNARKRGDASAALGWYARAFDASQGPATRLQWGASYLGALVDLAPEDAPLIERVASQLIAEAAAQPNAFYERSARSLQRAVERLARWNADGRHADALARLKRQLDAVCGRLGAADPQRATCEALLPAAG
ncbi:MAG TPA: thioredoxin fold domain-containing protein [Ideonella sp.]|nr:thioredoxin fold domain-containing protein [Ideonella sp.]